MRTVGKIVKTEIKERTEDEITYECVIVTTEVERNGFKAKVQHIIDPMDARDWPLGGFPTVEVVLQQQEMELSGVPVTIRKGTPGETTIEFSTVPE